MTRKRIPSQTKRKLFEKARGHCQYPECLETLFPPDLGGLIHLAEMAHIIPSGKKGPRHEKRPYKDFDTENIDNLILLHPTCHARIDKRPDLYPPDVLRNWKAEHSSNLDKHVGIRTYETRTEVADVLSARMNENFAIWERYAPSDGCEYAYSPEAEAPRLWRQRMRSIIIPNHYHILAVLNLNNHLATSDERKVIGEYKEHVRGLTDRHVSGSKDPVIRYPKGVNEIFQ